MKIHYLFLLLLLTACISEPTKKVLRVDPREIKDINADYGAEDLHIFVKSMIQSMLKSKLFNNNKPYIVLSTLNIGEKVKEHIDTKLISNTIRTNLLKTKKVHFIDQEYIKSIGGNQHVDYILNGDIHAIKKESQTMIDNFYVLSLKLIQTQSAKIVWSEEKEIRKLIEK